MLFNIITMIALTCFISGIPLWLLIVGWVLGILEPILEKEGEK